MSVFVLKLIAVISMSIDHIGAVFSDTTPIYFRSIGRAAFPIYVFLISEGCLHTRNIGKYMLRLGIFALVSEIPFDLAASNPFEINFFKFTNVFYTLFLGVACVNVYEKLRYKLEGRYLLIPFIATLPIILAAFVLETDYGVFGVMWIFAMYLANTKTNRILVLLAGIVVEYGPLLLHLVLLTDHAVYAVSSFLCAMSSVVFVYFYNGKQGVKLKWAFYLFYPVHLALLAFIEKTL